MLLFDIIYQDDAIDNFLKRSRMKASATECQENNASDVEDDFANILYEVEGDLSEMEGEQDSESERSDDSIGESDFESDDSDLVARL